MPKRGRPEGYKFSDDTKNKISLSRTGQKHSLITRDKIARGVRSYFNSPDGLLQRSKLRASYLNFWSSDLGQEVRQVISEGLRSHYTEIE